MAARSPELLHVVASDAALAEFDTEDAIAQQSPAPVASPAPGRDTARAQPSRRGAVVAALVAAAVVLVAMGTRRELSTRSTALGAPAASVAHSIAPSAPELSGRTLAGSWRLTSRVVDTSVPRFRGLVLGYDLRIQQDGRHLRGTGIKAIENGRALRSRARTPIAVEGTIDGQTVQLAFTESGLARTSRGAFSLRLAADGSLAGGFWSDAARSSGTVTATSAD